MAENTEIEKDKQVSADASDDAVLKEAKARLEDCAERENDERAKQLEDVKFVSLDQWPSEIRNQRQNDPNGPRPCLTIDKTSQYRMQIINEIRKNRPSVKVRGVDSRADPATAEVLQGLTRHIEDNSRANLAYQVAAEWAIDCGVGYFRFVTDYVGADTFDQEIYIKPIFDPFSVYLGPHLWPDGSDAEYAFVIQDFPTWEFKQKWPNANSLNSQIDGAGSGSPFWAGKDTVRVAEYFRYINEPVEILQLDDGQVMTAEDYDALPDASAIGVAFVPPKPQVVETRQTTRRKVQWLKMTESEVLERTEWAGKYIPIVKVVGHQKLVDGKKQTWGIVRPAIDSARMYNYWASTITEKLALSPKMPYIGAVGQFNGFEEKWRTANTTNHAYLEYNPLDVNGNAIPAPHRVEPAPMEVAMVKQLEIIEHDIQTSLGMFKASVGNVENDQSGRAIRALQNQSDTATFHFPDNLAFSITYAGRIMIDLAPRIYDTKRVIRIIGDDGQERHVQLDPNQQEAVRKIPSDNGAVRSIYNINVGLYDVTATVGPSYATKRMEMVDVLQSAMQNNPNLVPLVGDLMFRALDAPGADKIADRLAKMLPPQLQEQQPDAQAVPPEAQQKIAQLTQAAQAMSQEINDLRGGAQEAQAKRVQRQQEIAQEAQMKRDSQAAELLLAKEKAAAELALKREVAAEEASLARQRADAEAELAKYKAEMEARTKIEVAEIQKNATLTAAQIGAANVAAEADSYAEKEPNGKQGEITPQQIHIHMPSGKRVITTPDGRQFTSEELQ